MSAFPYSPSMLPRVRRSIGTDAPYPGSAATIDYGSAPVLSGNTGYSAPRYRPQPSAPNLTTSAPQYQMSRAPMAGGARPEDYDATSYAMSKAATARAAQPAAPINRLSASNTGANKISEESLRVMWDASKRNYSQNYQKALNDFAETAAKYNVDGHALVDHWTKGGTAGGNAGYDETVATPGARLPISMVGTDRGGTPAPGLISMERGQTLDSAPTMSTVHHAPQGYSSVGSDYMIPSTQSLQRTVSAPNVPMTTMPTGAPILADASQEQARRMIPMAQIRDQAQQPYSQGDQERVKQAEVARLDDGAIARAGAAPVTQREQFNQQGDIAQSYANAPVKVAEARGRSAAQIQQDKETAAAIQAELNRQNAKSIATGHDQARANGTGANARDPVITAHQTRIRTATTNLNKALEMYRVNPRDANARAQVDRYFKDLHDAQGDFEKYIPPATTHAGAAAAPDAQQAPAAGASKAINSQAEYDQLKPGDAFTWNGKSLVKGK